MTHTSTTAEQAGERLNRLCEEHADPIVIVTKGQHRFHVSTDDHRVLFEDQGERAATWLYPHEARELAGALDRAVGWLREEELASAAFTLALDEETRVVLAPSNDEGA